MQKRVRFIEGASERLGLRNVVLLCGRAEAIGQEEQHRESYDVCVARAVAELPTLAELCLPLVAPGGLWMPAKGPSIEVSSIEICPCHITPCTVVLYTYLFEHCETPGRYE